MLWFFCCILLGFRFFIIFFLFVHQLQYLLFVFCLRFLFVLRLAHLNSFTDAMHGILCSPATSPVSPTLMPLLKVFQAQTTPSTPLLPCVRKSWHGIYSWHTFIHTSILPFIHLFIQSFVRSFIHSRKSTSATPDY